MFAIQTAYAIIIKLVAHKVISTVRPGSKSKVFQVDTSDSEAMRSRLARLEDGEIFREIGFSNLLEGDFFSWYSTEQQWSDEIFEKVSHVFNILSEYEDHHMFDGQVKTQDFFKDLYMGIMPDKVRHSLGEFYTPPWLADNVISHAEQQIQNADSWTALDPCCGSGTFVTVLIRKVLAKIGHLTKNEQLLIVLDRVKGLDLNPLAVLTARINYFINIAHLIDEDSAFEIPVYLGDASYVPHRVQVGNVSCLQYRIATLKGELEVILPVSATEDSLKFSQVMTNIELHIKNLDEDSIAKDLLNIIDKNDRSDSVIEKIELLSSSLVDLERNEWNGIWARIITNFLTTANIGRFDIIVGNPPWIDWKNLPASYRERIKSLCVDRHLFSGDGVTGGINLNICALIANVAAENWLSDQGVLGFLMPESLLFQQSYEGFRKLQLKDNKHMYFQELVDWSASGHPFSPVQQRFLTYYIGNDLVSYAQGVPVTKFVKKKKLSGKSTKALKHYKNETSFDRIKSLFSSESLGAYTTANNSAFTYANGKRQLARFQKIAGKSSYKGREGIEFYPQELFLFKVESVVGNGKVMVINYQGPKSKHKIAKLSRVLETKHLHPLVKGVDISRLHLDRSDDFCVPFPYDVNFGEGRAPIPKSVLASNDESPLLMKYFNEFKGVLANQTQYNDKIIGDKHNTEFYSLARVGKYSHAGCFVAFRDNTKWQAVVVENIDTPWGEKKRPVFQNHAVTIAERPDGSFISRDEAHYICAILNAPTVGEYLLKSSDSRSFKIRPPIKIPLYNSKRAVHNKLRDLSVEAHSKWNDEDRMAQIDKELDSLYLALANKQAD